jgi:hypothetical protein
MKKNPFCPMPPTRKSRKKRRIAEDVNTHASSSLFE